jgi:hypothetical protein
VYLLVFHAYVNECTVQEAKSPVKGLVRKRCAEGFNSGVKGLNDLWVQAQTLQTAHTVVAAIRRLPLLFMLDYGLSLGDKKRALYLSQSVALHAPELVIKRRNSAEFF